METSGTVETGVNVEFWFRRLYECIFGGCFVNGDPSVFAAYIWMWISILGYLLALIGIFVIIYCTVRLFELRKSEEEQLGELILAPEAGIGNPRWAHIESLMATTNSSDWRQAIIEADILLEDMLSRQGYTASGVGEKLKQVEPADFKTLQDAWEAHKVRNQIAHSGSSFDLSEVLARRTMARYESVFREFELV
jgi:hypothetical protein